MPSAKGNEPVSSTWWGHRTHSRRKALSWAQGMEGGGAFSTWLLILSCLRQVSPWARGRSSVSTGALLGMWLIPLELPLPFLSPELAGTSVWIRSIKNSRLNSRPSAINFTDDEVRGVEGRWGIGICHAHTHGGTRHCPPWNLQLSPLTGEERLLVLQAVARLCPGGASWSKGWSPRQRISLPVTLPNRSLWLSTSFIIYVVFDNDQRTAISPFPSHL